VRRAEVERRRRAALGREGVPERGVKPEGDILERDWSREVKVKRWKMCC